MMQAERNLVRVLRTMRLQALADKYGISVRSVRYLGLHKRVMSAEGEQILVNSLSWPERPRKSIAVFTAIERRWRYARQPTEYFIDRHPDITALGRQVLRSMAGRIDDGFGTTRLRAAAARGNSQPGEEP